MTPERFRLSRREMLAAAALAASPIRASAEPASLARAQGMAHSIRPATPRDVPDMVELLVRDGEQRKLRDPRFWPLAMDARTRAETTVRAGLESSSPRAKELWLLAEARGRIVGLTHAMIVPVPPIYGVASPPGLFLDECFTTGDAPADAAEALFLATEAALGRMGASALIASCTVGAPWRRLYERHGYEAVTLYMGKDGLHPGAGSSSVRPARPEDVSGIVRLSADHRQTLAQLSPRFWPVHPEADSRFGEWMRRSLTLKDRDMFVAGEAGEVRGYIIAQPASPLLIPPVHDIGAIGVIDDFYDQGFATVTVVSNGDGTAADLVAAAEGAFARRAFNAALAVCPSAWTSKVSLLERLGYRTVKQWMLKT